ncbi:MAG: TetR/AcrR family transcriptional regulator [Solirubrobacterales bacterium]|nr:TetR/AcrR family transcriptional regulator [Solirubrobacterales bacterium]
MQSRQGPGRPRDPELDKAILAAAERQLRRRGYAGMSLESVAAAAGTTVPSLRRRYRDRRALGAAVVDSLRVIPLPETNGSPRNRAQAILENFERNLRRPHSIATLGTIIAEAERNPGLLERFRVRLVQPRRAALREALTDGISAGELRAEIDIDAAVSMLIGSFYAHYLGGGQIPQGWAARALAALWPVS